MTKFLVDTFLLGWAKALIAFLAALVYREIRKRYELRKIKDDTKFEFIEAFLKEDIKQKHHLVVEQAFLKYLGRSLNYDEIIFLVGLQNPMSSLNSFFMAQNYVAYDPTSKMIMPKAKYRNKNALKRRRQLHIVLYFLCAMAGVSLLLYSYELLRLGGLIVLPVLVVFVLTLFGAAYWQVYVGASSYFAEKLIKQIKENKGET
jgi:uncharacterized membrane protein